MSAANWKTIMNHPDFDFVCDIRNINYNYGWSNSNFYSLFSDWEYSDNRLAILQECYKKPKYGEELTDSVIQEWKDWHKEEEEEEVETPANLECCEMCGAPCLEEERREWTDYNGTEILYCDGCYDRMMERKQAKQQCECCDNEATESFDGIPSCKSCYDNGIEYLKSQGADI